jgi:hypothetical protein
LRLTHWVRFVAPLLALVVAAAVWFTLSRPDENGRPGPKTVRPTATFTPAARRAANEFLAAVGRKDRFLARRLLAPTAPCERRVVLASPFKAHQVSLSVGYAEPDHLYLDVLIRPSRGSFIMGLQRQGPDRWRVDYWDTRWGPQSPLCEAAQTSS